MENPQSNKRRLVQMQLHAKILTAHRAFFDVAVEVDSLTDQVAEVQRTTLVELLRRQAVKLDAITAQGDTSAEKILQAIQGFAEPYWTKALSCRWLRRAGKKIKTLPPKAESSYSSVIVDDDGTKSRDLSHPLFISRT
ncbi:hypothetical protein Ccrd_020913, partial [Cynara cardunculus var. scolymus]